MNLRDYCKLVLPRPPLSKENFFRTYEYEHDYGVSYDEYLIICSEHDALHYLYEENFSDENEIKIAKLEEVYNVGFVGRNYFYYCIPHLPGPQDFIILDDTITVEKIKSTAKQFRDLY